MPLNLKISERRIIERGKKQNTWSGYEFFRHRKIPSLSSYKIEPTSNERIIKSLTMPCFDYIPPKNSP
jgi:hypothetical protein